MRIRVLWPEMGMSSSSLGFLVGGAVLEFMAGGVLKSGSRREEPGEWVGVPGRRGGVGVHGGRGLEFGLLAINEPSIFINHYLRHTKNSRLVFK